MFDKMDKWKEAFQERSTLTEEILGAVAMIGGISAIIWLAQFI